MVLKKKLLKLIFEVLDQHLLSFKFKAILCPSYSLYMSSVAIQFFSKFLNKLLLHPSAQTGGFHDEIQYYIFLKNILIHLIAKKYYIMLIKLPSISKDLNFLLIKVSIHHHFTLAIHSYKFLSISFLQKFFPQE